MHEIRQVSKLSTCGCTNCTWLGNLGRSDTSGLVLIVSCCTRWPR